MTPTEIANSLRGKMTTEKIVKYLVDMEIEQSRIRKQQRESERMRQEWKEAQARVKLETERIIALEREQARQRREQERQAKEQERQAAQLAKHEAQIAELEFRMSQAEADIEAETERIAALYALMDIAAAEQAAAPPGSKVDIRAQKQIISYQSAIHAAEKRKAKAEFTKQTTQQKLSA